MMMLNHRFGIGKKKKTIHFPPPQMNDGRRRRRLIIGSRFFSSFSSPLFFSSSSRKPFSLMRLNSNFTSTVEPNISCTTFSILAPIYKRVDQQNHSIRESGFRALWFPRNQMILDSGHVYKFLRSQGFISSYDDAHQYTDSDAHRWVSHINHRGNICGVDFIWLCNHRGNNLRKPLRTSWVEAVFSIIKYQLQKASIAEDNAFAFLGINNQSDSLTYHDFCQALQKVNLTGIPHGLSVQETTELWLRADIVGNGVFDYEELKKIWNMTMLNPSGNCKERVMESKKEGEDKEEEAIGLKVKKAVLFPQEAEKGLWPENYNLSDHACLTVQFSPVKMICS